MGRNKLAIVVSARTMIRSTHIMVYEGYHSWRIRREPWSKSSTMPRLVVFERCGATS